MKVRIHRGATEIGGSCIEIQAQNESIVLDAGLPLDMPEGLKLSTPPVSVEGLRAIFISHGHIDHYGLVNRLPKVPVVMGKVARQIVLAASPFMRAVAPDLTGPAMEDRRPLDVGPFRITPYLVDHSACDAYALLIEADGKRLFYSGDFRLHGRKHECMKRLMASPPGDIDILLLEGTTIGRSGNQVGSVSEEEIEKQLTAILHETPGLALVNISAQNIDRLVSLYRASRRSGRTLLIDFYGAMILEATGNSRIPQSHWDGVGLCIPHAQRLKIKRNQWFADLERHSRHRVYLQKQVVSHPERYVVLFRRSWMHELENTNCLAGACLIHSQWSGYLGKSHFADVDTWLQRNGITFHTAHTSGHASPADLKEFAKALAPKRVVPIHTEEPQCFMSLYQSVELHSDGELWCV